MEHSDIDISDDDFEHEHHLRKDTDCNKIKYILTFGIHIEHGIA